MPNAKPHALVVDDDNVVRMIITQILHTIAFNVTEARDGGEALDLFRAGIIAGTTIAKED